MGMSLFLSGYKDRPTKRFENLWIHCKTISHPAWKSLLPFLFAALNFAVILKSPAIVSTLWSCRFTFYNNYQTEDTAKEDTSIDVSAGSLQGSKSQYLYFYFVVAYWETSLNSHNSSQMLQPVLLWTSPDSLMFTLSCPPSSRSLWLLILL